MLQLWCNFSYIGNYLTHQFSGINHYPIDIGCEKISDHRGHHSHIFIDQGRCLDIGNLQVDFIPGLEKIFNIVQNHFLRFPFRLGTKDKTIIGRQCLAGHIFQAFFLFKVAYFS